MTSLLEENTPDGFSSISSFNENGTALLPQDGETVLISKMSAIEFGYKGLLWDKLAVGFDVYHLRSTAGGGFSQVSSMVNIEDLPNKL